MAFASAQLMVPVEVKLTSHFAISIAFAFLVKTPECVVMLRILIVL